MLNQIDSEGNLSWVCPHCTIEQSAHVSHEQVRTSEIDPNHVLLPPCACGARTGINVAFSQEDLLPPIITYGTLATVPPRHGIIKVEIPGARNFTLLATHLEEVLDQDGRQAYIRVIDSVDTHPCIMHHLALARHMQAIGKMQ